MRMYYIYVIKCKDDSLYTGIAKNLCKRITEHYTKDTKCAKYTKSHPIKTVEGVWSCDTKSSALKLEYFIKHLTREQKLKLLNNPKILCSEYGNRLNIVTQLFNRLEFPCPV